MGAKAIKLGSWNKLKTILLFLIFLSFPGVKENRREKNMLKKKKQKRQTESLPAGHIERWSVMSF